MLRAAKAFCPGALVVEGATYAEDKDLPKTIAQQTAFDAWPLLILVDDAARATRNTINFLWTTFTRFEPAADLHARTERILRSHITRTGPLIIDARMKPWFPKEVKPDEATAELVTSRWKEYFPQGMEMGNAQEGHLG
jgi:3-polyprenyl-4-hydroxybenzoate decarboxylase